MADIVERWYGMVAENKPLETNNILVWPTQRTPWMQGDVQSKMQTVTVSTKDSTGKPIEAKAVTDVAHEATWLATDSSWTTAPDVQRGEIVEIIRFADKNQYYWRERGDGIVRRRLETKRMMVSGSRDAGLPSPETHYMLEVSGHTGAINISTPMVNGETTTYLLTLNGKGGMASLSDGLGNEVLIDSKNKTCRMRNEAQSTFELNDQDILMSCLGDAGIVAAGQFLVKANSLTFDIATSILMKAGETIELKAGVSATVNTPDIYLNGLIHLNGPIVQDSSTSGDFTARMKGPVVVEQDVTAGGISLISHRHSGVQTGGGQTNIPIR